MTQIIYVGLGGFLGAICRYLLSRNTTPLTTPFPLGTLLVNVIGSFLLGLILYSHTFGGNKVSLEFRNFMAVGFIGAFTTMSTFAYETVNLMELKHISIMVFNLILNICLCLIAIVLGRYVALMIVK